MNYMAADEKFRFYAVKLSILCVIVFVFQSIFSSFTDALVLDSRVYWEVWRLVTAIFLHGSVIHLVYNLFALLLFGSIAERLAGGKKFLIVFFASGILANLVAVNFYSSSLGASGAIFGIIGLIVVMRPTMAVWAYGLPMPMFIAGILWVVGDLIGVYGFAVGNPIDNTGNIVHLIGMAIGLIFGMIYRNWTRREREQKIIIDEGSMRNWEDTYMGGR